MTHQTKGEGETGRETDECQWAWRKGSCTSAAVATVTVCRQHWHAHKGKASLPYNVNRFGHRRTLKTLLIYCLCCAATGVGMFVCALARAVVFLLFFFDRLKPWTGLASHSASDAEGWRLQSIMFMPSGKVFGLGLPHRGFILLWRRLDTCFLH